MFRCERMAGQEIPKFCFVYVDFELGLFLDFFKNRIINIKLILFYFLYTNNWLMYVLIVLVQYDKTK